MPIPKIPELNYVNRFQKDFGFQIVTNRDVLVKGLEGYPEPFRPHRIRFYAIVFTMQGEGSHFIDFKKYQYNRGTVFFISKEQVHAFEANFDRKARFMFFTEEFYQKILIGLNLQQRLSLFNYHLYEPLINLDGLEYPIFKQLVENIWNEYHSPDDFATEELIVSALRIFLLFSERKRKKKDNVVQSPYRKQFVQFQNMAQSQILKTRKVADYATQLNVSTKTLNRITQELMSRSAKTYLHDVFVLELKRLLMNTDLSIKEIGFASGFEETTNFVRYFKNQVGITPAKFRKEY